MKYVITLSLILAIGATSCKKKGCTDPSAQNFNAEAKKDDGSCTFADPNAYDVPTTYNFLGADGQTSVDHAGQDDRLEQILQIIAKMDLAVTQTISAQDLKDMFANTNGNGNGNFTFTSSRQLKDKCFILDQVNIENWMDSLAYCSQFNGQTASNGVAGTLDVNGKLHLYSAKGIEYAEKIEKGLMGAVAMYQALNVYFSPDKINVAENNSLVAGKNYTQMEHYFDEAFGYFGVDASFPTTLPTSLWGKYCNKQNVILGCNALMMNNFLKGRAAISNKVYADRDASIVQIQNTWEEISAAQALDYLNVASANFSNQGVFFHALTEAYGFVYSLRFAPDQTRNMTQNELQVILDKFGTNYWNLSLANVQAIKADLDAKYN